MEKVTKEQVGSFLAGNGSMEHVIKIECSYDDNEVYIIYRDLNGNKRLKKDSFKPFVWVTQAGARQMFNGNRFRLKDAMSKYNIGCKGLIISSGDNEAPERMKNGYNVMFYAKNKMSYSEFMRFFNEAKVPIYPKQSDKNYGLKYFVAISPVEQYMISTGIRMFKGYEDYDDLVRMAWDIETEGLDPNIHMISQIGVRTNKGFEKIITIDGKNSEEKFINEFDGIKRFFEIIKEEYPDVITGHNTENFDWVFIDTRLQKHGTNLESFSENYFPKGIYKKKKQAVLKLGGEIEYYFPTLFWGTNVTDSLHAVRRAQALDSTMKKADLKYVTKFSKLNKPNRVYVPGKVINKTWCDLTDSYAFNNENGDWYKITEKKPITEGYNKVTGRYIVQRYLLDDLYEGDKVESRYNQSNFLVGKMLPISYERACTMGTAGIWKSIMMAWSYEHNLAIPLAEPSRPFTGGLSRLIQCGFVDNVAKFDYNSLYPSIILSFDMHISVDIMDAMPSMLEYVLTQREYYKGLKKKYGEEAKKLTEEKETLIKKLRTQPEYANLSKEEFNKKISKLKLIKDFNNRIEEAKSQAVKNDKMQLPLKILGNSWFGSVSSGVFYWDDIDVGERITCTGRQMYRLLNYHFMKKGYKPIVGDSVTGDTPLFIKYKHNDLIDIKPISEIFSEKLSTIDNIGREYDTTEKPYYVLARSGWVSPKYVYRHKTDKQIYKVSDGDMVVECTKDHSLFNSEQQEVKPFEINENTKLEYYNGDIDVSDVKTITKEEALNDGMMLGSGKIDRVPIKYLNTNDTLILNAFLNSFTMTKEKREDIVISKTLLAGILFLGKRISKK